MEIKIVKIEDLRPSEYNPRKWNEKQFHDLEESIKRFGMVDPIIANAAPNRKNVVIGGHFRLHVARILGWKEVPVVYVNIPDEEKERELNLRLNKNLGEWDYDLLANFGEEELLGVGFESEELDRIFEFDEYGEDDFDAEKERELIQEPSSKLGDLYQLGEHRLLCGDATKREDIQKLMEGIKADMIFTDPPYNINYSGKGKKTNTTIYGDNQTSEKFRNFLTAAFRNISESMKDDAALYTCYSSRTHREFEDSLNAAGFEVKNQIIWVKLLATIGWGDYRWKHEPILYCHKKESSVRFYGDRKQYTEWHEEKSDRELLQMIKRAIKKEEKDGSTTIWKLGRDTNYDHPTQKPLQLCRIAIKNSSKRGDVVLDPFGRSGSTLIACEQKRRICYMAEIDPKYVDVIISRWEKFTGKKAVKIN